MGPGASRSGGGDRKRGFREEDRVFSNTSLTFRKALAQNAAATSAYGGEAGSVSVLSSEDSDDGTAGGTSADRRRRKRKSLMVRNEDSSDGEFVDSRLKKSASNGRGETARISDGD